MMIKEFVSQIPCISGPVPSEDSVKAGRNGVQTH